MEVGPIKGENGEALDPKSEEYKKIKDAWIAKIKEEQANIDKEAKEEQTKLDNDLKE